MNEPRGFNPVGEHAPGLPRHDAPLPGHVPGQYNPGSGDDSASAGGAPFRYQPGAPVLGERFLAKWVAPLFVLGFIYLTVPVQMVLYPLAGAAALVTAGPVYLLFGGASHDTRMSWTWFIAFLAILAALRFENGFAEREPQYARVRQVWRLLGCFAWFTWYQVHWQHTPAGTAFVVAAVATVLMYFILRSRLAVGLWHALQYSTKLRANA